MKNIVLIRASKKEKVIDTEHHIASVLADKQYNVFRLFGSYDYPFDPILPNTEIDMAIAIGGDGTVLKAARICAKRTIPILPVKIGDFGFINDIQENEWQNELQMFLEGKVSISKLLLLEISIADTKLYAANDITLCATGYGTIRASVFIGDEFLSRYKADGLLIATPIGSTAHSLSIGGPIIVPGLRAMMFIPIAPFTLSNRPLVLSSNEKIHIRLDQVQRTHSLLVIDGKVMLNLLPNSHITVTESKYTASVIQSSKRSYFKVLREKLGWSGEFRA